MRCSRLCQAVLVGGVTVGGGHRRLRFCGRWSGSPVLPLGGMLACNRSIPPGGFRNGEGDERNRVTGTATRIGGFAALLVLVFAAASFAGSRIDPSVDEPASHDEDRPPAGGPGGRDAGENPPGLAVAEGGYRLIADQSSLAAGTSRRALLPDRLRGRRHRQRLRRRARAAHAPDRRPPGLRGLPAPASRGRPATAAGRSGSARWSRAPTASSPTSPPVARR